MWSKWELTDSDCCQHIRRDGTRFEMIQCVWLDTTIEDKVNGLTEYCVVRGWIDLNDYSPDEITCHLSPYNFVEKPDDWLTAECILENEIVCDDCVTGRANTLEEAQEIISRHINTTL